MTAPLLVGPAQCFQAGSASGPPKPIIFMRKVALRSTESDIVSFPSLTINYGFDSYYCYRVTKDDDIIYLELIYSTCRTLS